MTIAEHLAKELYIFSGLGADERIFQQLDFTGFTANFIKWVRPHKNEKIHHYATRILEQIKTSNPVLIGLSFGGIIAVEIAKQIETEKIILIASVKTKVEIPLYFRIAGRIGVHKLIPLEIYKSSNLIHDWFFGSRSNFDIQLLQQILKDTDPVFLKWAIDKAITWRNQTVVNNILHIHGSKDKLLPVRFVNCNITVQDGGHLMTLNKSEELNRILRQQL